MPGKQAGITRRVRRFKGEFKMRKIALGMAVAASAIATPAAARDGQAYFGADMGIVVDNNFDVHVAGVEDAVNVEHDQGCDDLGDAGD